MALPRSAPMARPKFDPLGSPLVHADRESLPPRGGPRRRPARTFRLRCSGGVPSADHRTRTSAIAADSCRVRGAKPLNRPDTFLAESSASCHAQRGRHASRARLAEGRCPKAGRGVDACPSRCAAESLSLAPLRHADCTDIRTTPGGAQLGSGQALGACPRAGTESSCADLLLDSRRRGNDGDRFPPVRESRLGVFARNRWAWDDSPSWGAGPRGDSAAFVSRETMGAAAELAAGEVPVEGPRAFLQQQEPLMGR